MLTTICRWLSWCVPAIPVFGRLKRGHNEFKASLSYTARCCLKSPVGLPEFMKSSFSFLAVLSSSWGPSGWLRLCYDTRFIVDEKGKMYSTLPRRIMFWENLTWHPASCWYPDGMGKPDHDRSHTHITEKHPTSIQSCSMLSPTVWGIISTLHPNLKTGPRIESVQSHGCNAFPTGGQDKEQARALVPKHQQVDRGR